MGGCVRHLCGSFLCSFARCDNIPNCVYVFGVVFAGNSSTAIFVSTPEFVVGMRIIIAGVLSCVNLLLFVLSWQVAASVSFLALYFATWQYINVVVFARIALALKVAQFEQQESATKVSLA